MTQFNPEIPDREFYFTDQDFHRIRKLIYQQAGISLSDSKKAMVYSRVGRRLRATGLSRFDDYLALLETNHEAEIEAFINALTTNLTAFFREEHHFPVLTKHLAKLSAAKPIKLWSCGTSSGEEAYSLAMAMVDLYQSFNPPVKIYATDLDTEVLKIAQTGIYPLERVEKLPADKLQRFFLKGVGAQQGLVRVRPELQEMIEFYPLNLLEQRWLIKGPLDAIFCRNVMIYFDKATQRNILQRFLPLMSQDGLLFAGHSESFHHSADIFKLIGRTVYAIADQANHLQNGIE